MAEGTRDYKRLEGMLKECEHKREKEMSKVEEKLDSTLSRVEERFDAALAELRAMMNGITHQQNELRSQASNRDHGANTGSILGNPAIAGGDNQGYGNNRYGPKLEFPRFEGEGVEDWIFKVEQIFFLEKIAEGSKIGVISLYLEGCALQWHKNFVKNKVRAPEWQEYREAMKARFGVLAYDDPMAEMKKLKQTGSFQEYLKAFEFLMDRAQLNEDQALSCFLAGLRLEVEIMVRMFNPRTLQAAYSLAKLQDALKNEFTTQGNVSGKGGVNRFSGGSMWPYSFKNNVTNVSSGNMAGSKGTSSNMVIRKPLNLTTKQLEEKRLNNQCFWCEEKFVPGHKCKNRQLYLITVQDGENESEEDINEVLGGSAHQDQVLPISDPYLSLHALEGTFNFRTMRIRGSVGKRMLCVLIDTGSTHNFINSAMASKLGCVMEAIPELKVSAANGEELRCSAVCKGFTWCMQGQTFVADVLALPLGNYNLVLGIQWLVELEDIMWNFKELQMRFKWRDKDYRLQGSRDKTCSMFNVSSEKMDKMLSKQSHNSRLQCFELQVICCEEQ